MASWGSTFKTPSWRTILSALTYRKIGKSDGKRSTQEERYIEGRPFDNQKVERNKKRERKEERREQLIDQKLIGPKSALSKSAVKQNMYVRRGGMRGENRRNKLSDKKGKLRMPRA